MKVFAGKVKIEDRDACDKCFKYIHQSCALIILLNDHEATMIINIEYCKEVQKDP